MFLILSALCLSACTNVNPDLSEEHLVGQKLKNVSSLTTEQGSEQRMIVMYDS